MSEYALYDIIKMRAGMFQCNLLDIIKMKAGMCLNAL